MTNRQSSRTATGTTRAQEVRLEQDGQGSLFPTRRHGAGAWGGYRRGSGQKRLAIPRRGHSVYVTDEEWTQIQALIRSMRADTQG